ncbi:peptidase M23 [Microbacterium sp. CH12i]|uniref:M23 family metallopeptidase n=1 Tax=Microbacterium sp. CH12i TaxID=1479651 RepID=UPI000460CF14|nr:M23 family metallopeptidase [Microbacterium sp. CH12i]KDA06956.1 peptidase M23 [Microbacterium sp. CH12i]
MSTDAVDEESGSLWNKLLAIGLVLVAVFVLVVGGFFAVFMGVIAAAAGAVGDETQCVPQSTTGWAGISSEASAAAAPDSMEIPYGKNGTVTLDAKQLAIASRIIAIGSQLRVSDKGIKVAFMTALQESRLRMLASSRVPESLDYPHDGVGSDHDSVNPFQQRPSSGWGSVAELMNLDYSIKAFFGGPDGPNGGSPRGLLDVSGWESMHPGEAAQTVQVSAFPDAYDKWEAAAEQLMSTLGPGVADCSGGVTGEIALPLQSDYNQTSDYGPRNAGVAGASSWHAAIDLQRWPAPCGDPVYAILPGKVVLSSALWLSIEHADGYVVSYLHMFKSQRLVDVGDTVEAGQQVGVTGNVQPSSGCHLDLRINVENNTNPDVAGLILSQNETRIPPARDSWNYNYVNPEDFFALWGVELCPAGTCK